MVKSGDKKMRYVKLRLEKKTGIPHARNEAHLSAREYRKVHRALSVQTLRRHFTCTLHIEDVAVHFNSYDYTRDYALKCSEQRVFPSHFHFLDSAKVNQRVLLLQFRHYHCNTKYILRDFT